MAEVGGPVLVAGMGRPARFPNGAAFKSYTGLAPRASETGDTDRKGQPMSCPVSSCHRLLILIEDPLQRAVVGRVVDGVVLPAAPDDVDPGAGQEMRPPARRPVSYTHLTLPTKRIV